MRSLFPVLTATALLLLGFYFYLVLGGIFSPKPIFLTPPSGNAQSKQQPKSTYSTQQLIGFPQGANLALGEELFDNNCASCHHPSRKLLGPPLGASWDKFSDDREFLYAWVRNSPQLIEEGDPQAIALASWGPETMLPFPTMTEVQIASILAYAKTKAEEQLNPNPKVMVSNE